MTTSRRQALTLAAAGALAACQRHRLIAAVKSRPMDTALLSRTFPALAARALPGVFVLGVMDLQTTTAWYWDTARGFPLGAAAAAPIATAALAQVDAGQLSLTEPVTYTSLDLSPPPSLLARDWPNPPDRHTAQIAAADLFRLALREDDATAIDVLMRRIGGPGAVSAFLDLKKVLGVRVDRYQREIEVAMFGMPTFRAAWKDPASFAEAREAVAPRARQAAMNAYIRDPRDTATAPAALGFLGLLVAGELISASSTARLLAWMESAPGSLFKPGLPADWRVSHATGAAPLDLGFEAAVTELAVVTAGPGRRYALAGFLAGSTATAPARATLFADAARLAVRAIG
jgi:beta-lactamase class A